MLKKLGKITIVLIIACVILIVAFVFIYNSYLFSVSSKVESTIPYQVLVDAKEYNKKNVKTTKFFRKLTYDWGVPSLSVAVAKNSEIIYSAAFGYSRLFDSTIPSPNLSYRIHSVSKVFTSTLIAELIENGLLTLNDTVQRLLPEHFVKSAPFTIYQLLTHRSGIRHYKDDYDLLNKTNYKNTTETLKRFENDTLLFYPGKRHSYSSYGYNVLGAIIEKKYDTTYQVVLDQHISKKINVKSIKPFIDSELVKYYELDSVYMPYDAPKIDESVKIPSGGLEATPTDLVKFGSALLNEELISGSTFDLFTTVPDKNKQEQINYALGWETSSPQSKLKSILKFLGDLTEWKVPHTVGCSPMIFHQGGSYGGMSMLAIYPEYNLVFAFMTNGNGNLKPIYKMPMMGLEEYFKN